MTNQKAKTKDKETQIRMRLMAAVGSMIDRSVADPNYRLLRDDHRFTTELANQFSSWPVEDQSQWLNTAFETLEFDPVLGNVLQETRRRMAHNRGAEPAVILDAFQWLPLLYVLACLKIKSRINLGKLGRIDVSFDGNINTLKAILGQITSLSRLTDASDDKK